MDKKIDFILGDITEVAADAIVNAANESLLGGGGVDGAIHRAAGPELLEECRTLGGCETGEAKITKGYNLPAKYVIHTVGPIWLDGLAHEDELLAKSYRSSLRVAEENNLRLVVFPSISTGSFGFPVERAAPIAVREVMNFLKTSQSVDHVTFALFSERDFDIYKGAYESENKGNKS